MSDVSMGPGWWMASDGKWYPPHLHPNALAQQPAAPAAAAAQVAEQPLQGWPPAQPGFASGSAPPQKGSGGSRRRTVIFIGAAAVIVAVAAIIGVSAISSSNGVTALKTGPGTASVTWHTTTGCMSAFSGTAAGLSLSGTAEGVGPRGSSGCLSPPSSGASSQGSATALPSSVEAAQWDGQLGGKSFSLKVSIDLSSLGTSPQGPTTVATIDGTFGSEPVHVTVTASPNSTSNHVMFHGTVGNMTVSGTATFPYPSQHGGIATFTITK